MRHFGIHNLKPPWNAYTFVSCQHSFYTQQFILFCTNKEQFHWNLQKYADVCHDHLWEYIFISNSLTPDHTHILTC